MSLRQSLSEKILSLSVRDDSKRGPRICHALVDGSIKAEEVRGGRLIRHDSRAERVQKGVWLELAKNAQGKGLLRLRSASRENLLLSVPLASVKRVGCARKAGWWSRLAPARGMGAWSCGLPGGRARVLEVEGTVDGCRVAAEFAVRDPEAWMHAVEHPEWATEPGAAGVAVRQAA